MSGRTKKEAKTNAARATFAELLGLSEDDLQDDEDDGEGTGTLNMAVVMRIATFLPSR